MKLLSYGPAGAERPAVLVGEEQILDLAAVFVHWPRSWRQLLAADLLPEVKRIVQAGRFDSDHLRPLADIIWAPPIPNPSKIIALGRNYPSHAAEQKRAVSERPLLFAKAPSCLLAHRGRIIVPAHEGKPDAEAEMALIIGRRAKQVAEDVALEYVAAITAFNDVSGREAQFGDKLWLRGKSYDTFGPAGPWAVTLDEAGDIDDLQISLRVNDRVWQAASTAEMMVSSRQIVAYVSAQMTLLPGDLIATGTPAGVGVFQEPPLFLQDGDRVEVCLEKVGTLQNSVVRAGVKTGTDR